VLALEKFKAQKVMSHLGTISWVSFKGRKVALIDEEKAIKAGYAKEDTYPIEYARITPAKGGSGEDKDSG